MTNLSLIQTKISSLLNQSDSFVHRHIGPTREEIEEMMATLNVSTLDQLIDQAVPPQIRMQTPLKLEAARSEHELLKQLQAIASKNQIFRSFIGMGYHRCLTPPVIQRNILENPSWYTQYTPYQAEIAQGRLEALLNFQTMVTDLTGLDIANASLLDEGTAAAEAMTMSYNLCKEKEGKAFFIANTCHPQTIEVICSRAKSLGIETIVDDPFTPPKQDYFGILLQYPATDGRIYDYRPLIDQAHENGAFVTLAADLLSLTLLKSPGELGADIAVGNTQRFGVPLGYGGPHAAYFATKEAYKRQIVGRLVGISKDVNGKPALRLALQTREQHIRRDRATSNICTAQALLAIVASMYAVYHGPEGLKKIAQRIHLLACILPISWMYISLMGETGLTEATKVAILNANYIAARLEPYYPILYRSQKGWVAHECILDLRELKRSAGITVDDIAKRLMDYGFHAPTISWPVSGTMMIEPTESESKQELDRFCTAMITIRQEIAAIEAGKVDRNNNLLKNAPHTHEMLISDHWQFSYPREQAGYPTPWLRDNKFWPAVGRIDNAFGDRNLVCSCLGIEAYQKTDSEKIGD